MSLGTFIRGIFRKGTGSSTANETSSESKTDGEAEGNGSSPDARANGIRALSETQARELLRLYDPLIEKLNAEGVDYCVVGGLGVMMQSLAKKYQGKVRYTQDIDLMVGDEVSDEQLARLYVSAYSESPEEEEQLRLELFGNVDDVSELAEGEEPSGMSLIGVEHEDKETPNVDFVRKLNGFTLEDIDRETLFLVNAEAKVATVEQLKVMKSRTIDLYGASFGETLRPQDWIDARRLDAISSNPKKKNERAGCARETREQGKEAADAEAERNAPLPLQSHHRKGTRR